MKVSHVGSAGLPVFKDAGGAIQRRIAELASAQVGAGHDVTVYSPAGPGFTGEREVGGVQVRYLGLRVPPPLGALEFQARVSKLLRRDPPPDVIHFHSQPEGALVTAGVPAAKIMSYDNFYFRRAERGLLHSGYRRALARFDALLPCSAYCASASRDYWSLDGQRMHVFFNGVNLDQFHPDDEAGARERRQFGTEGKVILYVGRVCEQKGSDTLLDAYQLIRDADDDVQLAIAGPIEQFYESETSASTREWQARMSAAGAIYLGRIPDSRLAALYNAADLFVMPTRTLEMFGMAVVEAQACGTPVVASDHGGLRETVPDGCGVRFPPGDPEALADAVLGLLGDDQELARYGARGAEHAQRFAWPRLAPELDEIYRAVARSTATAT
jgi:glycosyltransferase involved in cell wall biosynthesis